MWCSCGNQTKANSQLSFLSKYLSVYMFPHVHEHLSAFNFLNTWFYADPLVIPIYSRFRAVLFKFEYFPFVYLRSWTCVPFTELCALYCLINLFCDSEFVVRQIKWLSVYIQGCVKKVSREAAPVS